MPKPRAHDLGILFEGTPGPNNAITDVDGVQVGYSTVIQGDKIRTGVTVIHPAARTTTTLSAPPGSPSTATARSPAPPGWRRAVFWKVPSA